MYIEHNFMASLRTFADRVEIDIAKLDNSQGDKNERILAYWVFVYIHRYIQ
jgi:hypothetical protein